MGLYDERLASLGEARSVRVAKRQPSSGARSTEVQSLLFERREGWTVEKAKSWARSHGYSVSKADVTDQHVRLRQHDPQGSVHRTIPFGRGIRAVVAREGKQMAVVKAPRRRRRKASKKSAPKRARRRRAKATSSSPRRKRRRVKSNVVQAAKRRRRRSKRRVSEATAVAAPRRRRAKRRTVKSWYGNSAGHATAARKGWRKRKAKRKSSPKRRRGKRRVNEVMSSAVAAPRRRRRRTASKRRMSRGRRRTVRSSGFRGVFESSRNVSVKDLAITVVAGGVGFLLADGLDRFLATYNPSTGAVADKFSSPGTGALANTLNIANKPDWKRLGAGVGATAVPFVASRYVRGGNRTALQAVAFGAGISFLKTLVNNVVVPMLVPKDTSVASLQSSYIARLYPSETAAALNLKAAQMAVSSGGSGALSGAPQQIGTGDVGPFAGAVGGESPYADAATALRREAGLQGYPSLENTWGTGGDSPYPSAAQALTGSVGWQPGPPPGVGPGPQTNAQKADCACLGDGEQYSSFLGDESKEENLFLTGS